MNKNAKPNGGVPARRRARRPRAPGRVQGRAQPHICNWMVPLRCCEAAEIVFESGLGYCREHAATVTVNREWLRQFFAQRQEERAARTLGPETKTLPHP
jgi:hypothetical protein